VADDVDGGLARVQDLGLDLLQLALDLAGIADPTPASDGASALISLARGQWLDAALSGISIIPYVGDLAKAGKLPKYLRTVENAIELARRSPKYAEALLPAIQKIGKALDLLPVEGNRYLRQMKAGIDGFLGSARAGKAAAALPDVSKQFRVNRYANDGKEYLEVSGRLGVPGKVRTHRSASAQRRVSQGTGDDAGHLIANEFGAPGGVDNLSRQNWIANRGAGTYRDLEREWGNMLRNGTGIEVKVTDVTRAGEGRPFYRRVEWTEVSPSGERTPHTMLYSNPQSAKSRAATGVEGAGPEGPGAQVYRMDDYRNRR
jgi:hypothetical protein